MKKEITEIKDGVYRITTLNERFYAKSVLSKDNGLPTYQYFPSVTWICGYYPKGIGFYKWLADKGWDESETIKNAAGDKGSKVHYACEDIDRGVEIDIIQSKYVNPSTTQPEALTIEEVECILSYRDFIEQYKPTLLASELTVFSDITGGTIDKIFAVTNKLSGDREIWILDLKTSKNIWEEMKLQLSAYSHMDIDYKKLGITEKEWSSRKLYILQLGYRLNKAGYKLTELPDKYDLFLVAYKLWQNENPNAKPKEAEYPTILKSNFRIEELKKIKVVKEKPIKITK